MQRLINLKQVKTRLLSWKEACKVKEMFLVVKEHTLDGANSTEQFLRLPNISLPPFSFMWCWQTLMLSVILKNLNCLSQSGHFPKALSTILWRCLTTRQIKWYCFLLMKNFASCLFMMLQCLYYMLCSRDLRAAAFLFTYFYHTRELYLQLNDSISYPQTIVLVLLWNPRRSILPGEK